MKTGLAGRLAGAFINTKLTPLIIIASLLLGVFAVIKTPREEEPQIIVPMADVMVSMPGASAKEVEQRISTPLEKQVWEIPGVEYVYSTSSPGQSMIVVRFLVGQDEERAFVRLREKLQANFDKLPAGSSQPVIKARSIDDVPVLALTFHGSKVDAFTLRQIASRVEEAVKSVPDVSQTALIGGPPRSVRVILDRSKMQGFGVTSAEVLDALSAANRQTESGKFSQGNDEIVVKAGGFFKSATDVSDVVITGGRFEYRILQR